MKKQSEFSIILSALLASGLSYPGISQAALLDRGNGLIYDTVLDVTWLSDTHYAATEFRNNSSRVSDIINSVGTVAGHTLTSSDFDNVGSDIGRMTWWGATAWADQLVYEGYSDWRLPNSDGVTTGLATTPANELGYLNNVTRFSQSNFASLFKNYAATRYWLAQENTQDPDNAWFINFAYSGAQNPLINKSLMSRAWAVRSGDVTVVPEPTIAWLLCSGLGFFAITFRKSKIHKL